MATFWEQHNLEHKRLSIAEDRNASLATLAKSESAEEQELATRLSAFYVKLWSVQNMQENQDETCSTEERNMLLM